MKWVFVDESFWAICFLLDPADTVVNVKVLDSRMCWDNVVKTDLSDSVHSVIIFTPILIIEINKLEPVHYILNNHSN